MEKPENENRIATMFDKVAPKYDLLNALLSFRQDKRWRKKLVQHSPQGTQLSYLDVATGTGDVLIQLAKSHNQAKRFVGIDISQEMLRIAETKSKNKNAQGNISFAQMSAEKLSFPDQQFHCLSIAFGLRNTIDKEQALKEFYRVLKPGGTLLILEFFNPDNSFLAQAFQFYFHHILPKIGGLISDKEAYHYLPKSVSSFYSYQNLERILLDIGFEKQETNSFLFGSCRLLFFTKN